MLVILSVWTSSIIKRLVFVSLFFVMPSLGAQVTGNVFSRVFQIRYGGFIGSAFIIDVGEKQYFVTAEHMVLGAGENATIELLGNKGTWLSLKMRILHGNFPCVDVAVLIPDITPPKFLKTDDVPALESWFMGQEIYFLGFPYGLYTNMGGKEMHPLPLMKHGYISATVPCNSVYPGGAPDKKIILLDGINNHGFSGGPVVAPDLNVPGRQQKWVGIISGYKNDPLPLNVNGQDANNAGVAANSGIVFVIPFEEVTKLIESDKVAAKETKR